MTAPLLELRGVTRRFSVSAGLFKPRRALKAVNGVTLTINKGEVLGLVGESGCGKSTLARIALGLLDPSEGEIRLDGKKLDASMRVETARRIQPIFQDPYGSLNPRKTIAAIVSLPLRVHRVGDPSGWTRRTEEMLDLVGLPQRVMRAYPNQLSGGQRQRVAIARALANRPEIIVADEPTGALDTASTEQVFSILRDIADQGQTVVVVTHDPALAARADRRIHIVDGKIAEITERNEGERVCEAAN
jgi:peptide/nickel transport system ATP-binding protein